MSWIYLQWRRLRCPVLIYGERDRGNPVPSRLRRITIRLHVVTRPVLNSHGEVESLTFHLLSAASEVSDRDFVFRISGNYYCANVMAITCRDTDIIFI